MSGASVVFDSDVFDHLFHGGQQGQHGLFFYPVAAFVASHIVPDQVEPTQSALDLRDGRDTDTETPRKLSRGHAGTAQETDRLVRRRIAQNPADP